MAFSTEPPVSKEGTDTLVLRIRRLESELRDAKTELYAKRDLLGNSSRGNMSDIIDDANPYSRLMALKHMGIVSNYAEIQSKAVAVIGVGGVGSVVAEMLTRCGVGKLILYDCDVVVPANMNRLFFRPEHTGMTKVVAASHTLKDINPDVLFEAMDVDVTSVACFRDLCQVLQTHGMLPGRPVDLVLSCVDNYGARLAINRACLESNIPWVESGVSEDGVSGHIQTLLPGITACFECLPPLAVASGIDESTIRRAGVCAASLPTVMGVIAGMLAQQALKFLLSFGDPCYYMSYASMTNYTTVDTLRPNTSCSSALCCARQASEKYRAEAMLRPIAAPLAAVEHSSNEWDIQIAEPDDSVQLASAVTAMAAVEDTTDMEALMDELDRLNAVR